MNLIKITKSLIFSVTGILMLAGAVAYPVECGKTSCCCMPDQTDDLAFQQGHCGCGCGQFEESQAPGQTAIMISVANTEPVKSDFEYTIETNDFLFADRISFNLSQDNNSHSPPLILDNKYKPLIC